ncbi:MAG: DEAD/DEAH box helicase, partial [Candidatus Dormibacteraeota bacterium]|nr:DEAD/DEAH box helicase [Candidatus Dormibacteraeota bacterium]
AGELPAPRRSIWPAIYPRLVELVQQHRSTIIFVNSRRLAERLAARLNEQAGAELVLAHHGSVAREQRLLIEDRLKAGNLRGLVATSSLELGIDMGAVDLVVQVEAPPSVAAGIQRIGRAGHSVGAISRGTVFPKFRGDLLESAAVVEGMLSGRIELTVIPLNPLDVLAQQAVAMLALEEWAVDDLFDLVRRAYPFRSLGRRSFEAVLDMLAGRYPSDEFAELRPRIVWDRIEGRLRGRAGAQRLAVTNAGTIPDRGLYTVSLFDGGETAPIGAALAGRQSSRKIGELDEEMVFETRVGETIVLGASSWKVVDITPSQVLVSPAPGEPGKISFWHGDSLSRPVELGRQLGSLIRELRSSSANAAEERLCRSSGFEGGAARNLLAYLDDQAAATGEVPDDRTVVVERFRDEIGDWRVCVLTPFGGKVHAPWALALQAKLSEQRGIQVQTMYTDDGLALRLPDADHPLDVEDLMLEPEELQELVAAELPGTAMFASRFRENAARALLLPRRRPGQRSPLWQQRQRSADLLRVASRFPHFPLLAETYRECLADVFDLDALRGLLSDIRSHTVRVVSVDSERASPFASSLLFDYVGQFIYEGDAPLAERRAQALTLDRELLAELLGSEELREMLDPLAAERLELELQGLLAEHWPRDIDEAHDLLVRLGDLTEAELAFRGVSLEWLTELQQARRALLIRLAGEDRWLAAEDAGSYRDAFGIALPGGLPEVYLESPPDPVGRLLRRWARTHVPFSATAPATRWGLPAARVEEALAALLARGELISGAFRPISAGAAPSLEFCHPEVLRTLRRRSLAALRREAEAVPPKVLAGFLPSWQGINPAGGRSSLSLERLLEAVQTLQGVALPVSVVERDILPARVPGYRPALLDELIAMGEVAWVGRGALGVGDGRVSLYLRSEVNRLLPEIGEPAGGDLVESLRTHLRMRGASFFRDLYNAAGGGPEERVLDALWDLVWAGEVTNDTFAPLRLLGPAAKRRPPGRRPPPVRLNQPRASGRWSLVQELREPTPTATERLLSQAQVLLHRHGVLTRESVLAEGWSGGFAALYPVLRALEEAGKARRGYFVAGLGGSQFALPGAVDRLRAGRDAPGQVVALAATDPAQPYGAVLPWPADAEGQMGRVPGGYVVLDGGDLVLFLERGGRSLLTRGRITVDMLAALVQVALNLTKVELQRVDGEPVRQSKLAPLLGEAGFGPSPRGVVVWKH